MVRTSAIEKKLQEGVRSRVRLYPDGEDRFRVSTPFVYDDGDHFGIILKKQGDGWLLSDEGATYMRLTLQVNEDSLFDPESSRYRVLQNALSSFEIIDRDGELTTSVNNEDYGEALYKLVQGLIKVSDIDYLSKEIVSSTFLEDFRDLISETVPEDRYKFRWHDKERDPKKAYSVDCKVNGMKEPLYIYALQSDLKVCNATIGIHMFRQWGIPFKPIGIFEDQSEVSKKSITQFMDVCEIVYPNINGSKARITKFLKESISV